MFFTYVLLCTTLASRRISFVLGFKNLDTDVSAGVGFSLSSGYGTASVYSAANGTFINVAKIEGGISYREYIRSISKEPSDSDSFLQLSQHKDSIDQQTFLSSTLPLCPLPDRFCRYWPGKGRSNNALYPMILALRTAAEATLERRLKNVEISVSRIRNDRETYEAFIRDMDSALRSAGLKAWRNPFENGMLAASAHGIKGKCSFSPTPGAHPEDDPPQAVLTVENTRAALTATLWTEDCGVYDRIRDFHSYRLGQDSLDDCFVQDGRKTCERHLLSMLRNITRIPIESGGERFNIINEVVVFGEASRDQRLNSVLKDILREHHGGNSHNGSYGEKWETLPENSHVDPTFAASNGAAIMSWQLNRSLEENSAKAALGEEL